MWFSLSVVSSFLFTCVKFAIFKPSGNFPTISIQSFNLARVIGLNGNKVRNLFAPLLSGTGTFKNVEGARNQAKMIIKIFWTIWSLVIKRGRVMFDSPWACLFERLGLNSFQKNLDFLSVSILSKKMKFYFPIHLNDQIPLTFSI